MRELMNFIFGDVLANYHATFIPDIYYIVLDDSRRVSIHFYSTENTSSFNAISFAITDKYTGIVCKRTVMFKDILEGVDRFRFDSNAEAMWYKDYSTVELSDEDKHRMATLLDSYLRLWA